MANANTTQKTKYFPQPIEKKWQKKWKEEKAFSFKLEASKDKFYTLVELPYSSGDLHIGHWFTFTTPDVLSRFKKMKGFSVFFPMGFDAFGLPAENAAIKRKIHPQDWTLGNIKTMISQFETMGSMLDLQNVTITCLPEFYKWNQWIFIKMFEKGLAYRGNAMSNWCETDQTVLADENVENGRCWRCGNLVVRKEVEQWFLKITEYADRLIWPEKPSVDWPESVKTGQNNWIGKSTGLLFTAPVKDTDLTIQTFSAHFEACYADTFVVIAPDHPFLEKLLDGVPNKKEVTDFCNKLIAKRVEGDFGIKEPEGIFTGRYLVDPLGNGNLPIWVANFALKDYGTGIVKCSAHDERDFAFAKKYGLRLKPVLFPKDPKERKKVENLEVCYIDMKNGILSEPNEFKGRRSGEIREEIVEYLEKKGFAQRTTQYHIRDWSISRQRYWGTPVPVIHCKACGIVPVPLEELPIELPYDVDFTPKGKPPLASNQKWLHVKCPKCGKDAQRDPETLDTFFDSSWYFYRYVSSSYDKAPFDKELVKKLLPVDVYFGGSEHTLGHTLYARFFTKFFKDIGLVPFDEFANKRVQHGDVLGPDGARMSKSRGNVINPDDVVKEYGADTVRLYLCFMMPYDGTAPWSTQTIAGIYRFLQRIWQLREKVTDEKVEGELSKMHQTIKRVEEDLEKIKNNTAIAFLMEWLNELSRRETISKEEYKTLLLLLAPFAPHITEELWEMIGEKGSIHAQTWPKFDNKYLVSETINIPVQVNGKLRGVVTTGSGQTKKDTVVQKALD